jgi:secondary thiamine-phosphate synthase enzyme
MYQFQRSITLKTSGPGLTELTAEIAGIVKASEIKLGLAHVFCRHTSASLLIQENADPDVQRDLLAFFKRLVPDGDPLFVHRAEGPDDMPAHIKAALLPVALTIPVAEGRLLLGTWQGIYLWEHRDRPHRREVVAHLA